MKTIKATENLVVEIPRPDETDKPLVYVRMNDARGQSITVYSQEIGRLITALADAAGELVSTWVDERREHSWP